MEFPREVCGIPEGEAREHEKEHENPESVKPEP